MARMGLSCSSSRAKLSFHNKYHWEDGEEAGGAGDTALQARSRCIAESAAHFAGLNGKGQAVDQRTVQAYLHHCWQ